MPPPGFESQTVLSAACRNTDCDIAVTWRLLVLPKRLWEQSQYSLPTARSHIYALTTDTPNCGLQPSCAPNDLPNTQLKLCQILAVHILCLTIGREMVAVRDQTGGVTANLQDVRTVTTEDNSTRHAAVAHPDTHSFHRAVSAIAVLAQCFALLPVHGVTASSAQGLRFVCSLVLSGQSNWNIKRGKISRHHCV
jgi:hypothetical protein